ncbi:hydroxycarboxylic acid receptor 2-like [Colossoma macropomum]|uniref:hydroxycarboxylic acid receptor 2-like n=1 Tax=Colossoma macropomum TaxID=42526 RepID=UPI001864F3FC|nr:hydroxycarboxylic acid receptor 2-like [Colossoma macropomum]
MICKLRRLNSPYSNSEKALGSSNCSSLKKGRGIHVVELLIVVKMSSSYNNTHCGLSPQSLVSSILPPVLIVELLLGLPWNLLAFCVFCRHLQSWTPNVVFLLNLVLADFLLLVSLPFRINYLQKGEDWVFGDAWCRINLFMLAANRSASIGFMTAVAVDRYFKVVHPHHTVNFISSQQAAGIACFIWAVVFSLRLPLLLTDDLLMKHDNRSYCRSFNPYKDPKPGIMLHYTVYLAEFFLSLMVLLFCSFRICCILHRRHIDKKKNVRQAVRIVSVINVVFIICFCPGVATGLTALYMKKLGEEHCYIFKQSGELFVMAIGFTYLNSVLDPVIYGFCSSMFRDAVKKMINRFGVVELMLSHRGNTANGDKG